MNTVEAVKDKPTIDMVTRKLLIVHGKHYSQIWELGLQLALRISDLLSIKFSDIDNGRVRVKESKTGKTANILLNEKAVKIIEDIRNEYPDAVYLFQARARNVKTIKPLSRVSVAKAFKSVGDDLGLALGTHSMRKTRGYIVYQATKDIALVMKMLRHSSEAVTLRYIGITQETMDDVSSMVI
ncbi:TPA: tyrosine-type recombinase/integrase [Vibrio parahaemolyticus]|uniref:Integrase n=1 Tax=Vibrio panuliri TaxID=1381081 RepID=A0A1Q9HRQ2_9VIBR|nr:MULTISPECIES: tyrosine-type recombinase/integrase [Vibrio]KIT46458.1 hypothetical protein H337_06990 [Vibrio parahaemolyticus EN9701121]EGQ7915154.1 tyrosine-type recombinase/integrase [Vibrio parahaemolyticus]EGQ9863085.1 tyrosine-type recombinase/integrase [Vibrio parahaemolyticus]EGW0142868.1 site-specific integrase [Vibrio parahaemolyticus]EHB9909287.1 tyrosine-type recombinase/integrase [Vibrio parahaemolyticus]